jgi:hypothetical protein
MRTKCFMLFLVFIALLSCKKEDDNSLGGDPSPIGAVNNSFTISVVPGVQNFSAKVTDLKDDISTITYTADISGSTATALLSSLSGAVVNGNSFSRVARYKITTEGIQSVYSEGDLILVKYNAKVGDEWSKTIGNYEIKRVVTSVSSTDDFLWNNMMIKVVKVEETGRGLPGVYKLEFYANHKFGLVGLAVYLEDGSSQYISVISNNTNS